MTDRKKVLWATGAIQLLLVVWAFGHLIWPFNVYLTANEFDGFKNYFTFKYYIEKNAPGADAIFTGMNYPYGEYIFYTDNTPLLAYLLRVLYRAGILPENAGIPIFHVLTLLNFWVAALIFAWTGLELRIRGWLTVVFAISAVWVSPQMFKVVGSMNMAVISLYALVLAALVQAWRRAGEGIFPWKEAILLWAITVVAGGLHLYNLAIVGLWVGGFGFFALLFLPRPNRVKILPLLAVPVLAYAFTLMTLRAIDDRYEQRLPASGYNYVVWTMQPGDIFQAYQFLNVPHLWHRSDFYNDRYAFLGSAVFYGGALALALVPLLWRRIRRQFQERGPARRLMWVIGLSGFLLWLTALGDYVNIEGVVGFHNWLSPFYFMDYITGQKTQFRCIGRFNWPFFYSIYVLAFWGFDRLARLAPRRVAALLLGAVSVVAAVDTWDVAAHLRQVTHADSDFQQKHYDKLPQLDYTQYQALLPLPFFHAGNEVMSMTLDDNSRTITQAFQMSMYSGLPIVACKMSRTPLEQTRAHYSLFLSKEPDSALISLMNKKPLLVFQKKNYPAVPEILKTTADSVLAAGVNLPVQKGMEFIMEDKDFRYYKWYVAGPAATLEGQ